MFIFFVPFDLGNCKATSILKKKSERQSSKVGSAFNIISEKKEDLNRYSGLAFKISFFQEKSDIQNPGTGGSRQVKGTGICVAFKGAFFRP